MGDHRYIKLPFAAFEDELIQDNIEHVSQSFDCYNTPEGALLITVNRTGAPTTLDVSLQVSIDQGETWFTVQDGISAGWPTVFPTRDCFGEIPIPAGRVRCRAIGTGCSVANYYTISVTIMAYKIA